MRLAVDGLAVERGGRTLFAGLSFGLAPGELLVVRGRNGAGKSSLLRAIAGLLRPAAGAILLQGERIAGRADPEPEAGPAGSLCHYLGHLDALKPGLPLAGNLAPWRHVEGVADMTVEEAIAMVGLEGLEDLPAAWLSAGQKRRAALARLLLVKRPLWLLDEPTAALDVAGEALLGGLIVRHLSAGGLAICATHQELPIPASRTLELGDAPAGAAV